PKPHLEGPSAHLEGAPPCFEGATGKFGDASRPKEGAQRIFEGRYDPREGQYDPREGAPRTVGSPSCQRLSRADAAHRAMRRGRPGGIPCCADVASLAPLSESLAAHIRVLGKFG